MLCLSIFKFRQCIIIVQLISKRLIFVKPFLFLYCQDAHKLNVLAERSAESFPNVFLHQPHVLGMSAGFPADYPSRISDPAENILKAEKIPFYFISEYSDDGLLVGTDPLGLTPVYYCKVDDAIAFSNMPASLIDILQLEKKLSDEALSGWLAGQPVPELSLYENLRILPAGHYTRCNTQYPTIHRYWNIDPEHRLELPGDDDYARYFRELLHEVVRDYCGNSDLLACQMSGGMDSTTITSIAQKWQRKRGKRCLAVSHYYRNDPNSDESKLIEDMRQFLLPDVFHFQEVDESRYRNFLALYPAHFDHPGIVVSPRYRDELTDLKQAGVTTLLTGNGGDEMCWGHASAYTQRLRNGEFGVFPEVYRACRDTNMSFAKVARHLFIKPLVPESLLNLARRLKGVSTETFIQLPTWMTDKSRALAAASYNFANPFNERSEPVHFARYFALKTSTTFNSVRSYDAVADELGIRVKHPFFDRRIAEFSFAVPPKQLIRGAYPKFVLRNAMTNDLPESVCWRKTKTTFDHHFANLVRENADSLRECLSHTYLADRGLLNNAEVLKAFNNAVYNRQGGIQVDLLFVILTQRWIQTFHS